MAGSMTKNVKESRLEGQRRNWSPMPILGADLTDDVPLEDVYVGLVREKRLISSAIRTIGVALPGFGHLKRCSANRLLLAPLRSAELLREIREVRDDDDEDDNNVLTERDLANVLKKRGFDLSLLEDRFAIVKVPTRSPRTRRQAVEAARFWPVNFHPDPAIESLVDGTMFDERQLATIEARMSVAVEAARLEAVGNSDCTGSAVIVDPSDGRILAVAAARIDRHPMWHASMLAVDLVARLHGGGAWDLTMDFSKTSATETEDVERRKLSNGDEQSASDLNDEDRPDARNNETEKRRIERNRDDEATRANRHEEGVPCPERRDVPATRDDVVSTEPTNYRARQLRIKRKYEEEAPLFYPESLSVIRLPPHETLLSARTRGRRNNGPPNHPAPADVPKNPTEKCGPYLCTGYWAFLLCEPCPLCAMALLHSRVGRIFYGAENARAGILGSNGTLHAIPGLNHRYQVWAGVLAEECRKALEEIEIRGVS